MKQMKLAILVEPHYSHAALNTHVFEYTHEGSLNSHSIDSNIP